MAVSFSQDVKPMFRDVDINHMKAHGVRLDDLQYMSDPPNKYKNARAGQDSLVNRTMPPGGPFWTAEQLGLYDKWRTEGYQPRLDEPARLGIQTKPESMRGPEAGRDPQAIAQSVAAPLTRAAIFLVTTVKPGLDHRATVRSLCGDLSALLRAVDFRDLEGGLSCVVGFGSDAWDRLFGPPRPAELHEFREIRAGTRHAVSTPGDLLFHIRAKRMDLCFELAMQIMARLGDAVSPLDEVHGFRYFDDRDLLGFVDGTENPRGEAAMDAVLVGEEDPAFARGVMSSCRNISTILTDGTRCPQRRRSESSAAQSCRTSNWAIPSSQPPRTAHSQQLLRTGRRSRSCATTCHSAGQRTVNSAPTSLATAVRPIPSNKCSKTCSLAGRPETMTGCSISAVRSPETYFSLRL